MLKCITSRILNIKYFVTKKTRLEKIIKTCCKNYIKVNYNIIVCKKMCKELYNNDIIIVIIIND